MPTRLLLSFGRELVVAALYGVPLGLLLAWVGVSREVLTLGLVVLAAGALAALGLLAYRRARRARSAAAGDPATFEVDAAGVRRHRGADVETLPWAEVDAIEIVTTDDGPFAEDVFWCFHRADGEVLIVPGESVGDAAFDGLRTLPGVDDLAIIAAMGSTEHARFEVFRRPGRGGEPPTGGAPPL